MSWGIKTDVLDKGIEISGEIHSDTALKMNLSLDMQQNRFKVEIDNLQEKRDALVAR